MFYLISQKTASLFKIAVNLEQLREIDKINKYKTLPMSRIKSIADVFGPITSPNGLNVAIQKQLGISYQKPIINKSHGGALKAIPDYISNRNEQLIDLAKNFEPEKVNELQNKANQWNELNKNLLPKEKETINRISNLHENFESIVKPSETQYFSAHLSPNVILKEQNATLSLPYFLKNVRDFYNQTREIEFDTLAQITNIPKDRLNQRFSRHGIKNITNNYISKAKQLQQEMQQGEF